MEKLVAFNGDKNLKNDLLKEAALHREADAVIKGTYGHIDDVDFKGCAVGCTLKSYSKIKGIRLDTSDHGSFELFGIPRILARLEDSIFEGLPETHNTQWPEQFLSAINPGADLSTVWPKFAQYLLTDKNHGVIQYAKTDAQRYAIQRVSDLYRNGGFIDDFKLARAVAYAAAYAAYAAYAAAAAAYAADAYAADAYAADAYAATATATAAADAADAAAAAAADADADAAAAADADADAAAAKQKRFETRIAQSQMLIKLMKKCK